jgi:hypothetical protein
MCLKPLALAAVATVSLASGVAVAQTVGPAAASPGTVAVGVGTPVTVTAVITDPAVVAGSVQVQRYDSQGRVLGVLGTLADDGRNGDATAGDRTFTLRQTVYELTPGPMTLRVSAAFQGRVMRVLSAPFTLTIAGTPSTVSITTPANLDYRNVSPIVVTGTVGDAGAQVRINGVDAVVTGTSYTAQVPILEGTNTLTAVATNTNETVTTASVQVTLDTTPPKISINVPDAEATTSAATVAVSGLVNDIVVGTVNPQQATVVVNGQPAQVANRSFLVPSIALAMGANTIQATATDRGGNSATASIVVTRIAANGAIAVVSGNSQSAPTASVLPQPLVARITDALGQPVAGVPIVFRVVENSGGLVSGSSTVGSLAVTSNAQGQASVSLRLGTRSGVGNNVVEATATGFNGVATFTHSATATAAQRIVVDTGNGQVGAVGQALALPFVAIVTDAGYNRIGGVPVTFTVKQGGGTFAGQTTRTTTSDPDGRVAAVLTLGRQEGQDNNVVEATFTGNAGLPAAFLATGKVPADPSQTRITGVVLDNANAPIPGVTMRLFRTHQGTGVPEQVGTPVTTLANGQFTVQNAPVGAFKLMADGSTAPNGPWPTLEFDVVTVAGQTIDVGLPIYLPVLDAVNRLCVNETTGGTLTLPQVPGFSLTIEPGAATFAGGARSGCVSVTPVNGDKVPMSPGFGQQPRFVITIQPVGTVFNPAAKLTLPNVDGLAPRQVTEMYSYDHDLAAFVSIGTGTVSEDGSVISSDPGVGVIKAGWHCGGNPNPTGSAGTCPDCQRCEGTSCVTDASQNGRLAPSDRCKECRNGSTVDIPLSDTETSVAYTFNPIGELLDEINEGFDPLLNLGVIVQLSALSLQGQVTTKECCESETGRGEETKGSVTGTILGVDIRGKIWPLGPIPQFGPRTIPLGFVDIEIEGQFIGGVFIGGTGTIQGELGYRRRTCDNDAADRAGCFFGNASATLTPLVSADFGGSAELEIECAFNLCDETEINVSAMARAQVAWPWVLQGLSYNRQSCNDGFAQGGGFSPQPLVFTVTLRLEGTYQNDDGPVEGISYDLEFLRCQLPSDNGDYCQFIL